MEEIKNMIKDSDKNVIIFKNRRQINKYLKEM